MFVGPNLCKAGGVCTKFRSHSPLNKFCGTRPTGSSKETHDVNTVYAKTCLYRCARFVSVSENCERKRSRNIYSEMCESRISNMFWPNPPMHNATSPLKTYYEPPLNSQFERFRYLWN